MCARIIKLKKHFFRIDQGQEHLHYVTDISSEDLYILDPELSTLPLQVIICV